MISHITNIHVLSCDSYCTSSVHNMEGTVFSDGDIGLLLKIGTGHQIDTCSDDESVHVYVLGTFTQELHLDLLGDILPRRVTHTCGNLLACLRVK